MKVEIFAHRDGRIGVGVRPIGLLELAPRPVAGIAPDHAVPQRRPGFGRDLPRMRPIHDQKAAVEQGDGLRRLPRHPFDVEYHGDRAGLGHGIERDHVGNGVSRQDADMGAGAHPARDQLVGKLVGADVELLVAQPDIALSQRQPVRVAPGVDGQRVMNRIETGQCGRSSGHDRQASGFL